jgi:hypothetical protein
LHLGFCSGIGADCPAPISMEKMNGTEFYSFRTNGFSILYPCPYSVRTLRLCGDYVR